MLWWTVSNVYIKHKHIQNTAAASLWGCDVNYKQWLKKTCHCRLRHKLGKCSLAIGFRNKFAAKSSFYFPRHLRHVIALTTLWNFCYRHIRLLAHHWWCSWACVQILEKQTWYSSTRLMAHTTLTCYWLSSYWLSCLRSLASSLSCSRTASAPAYRARETSSLLEWETRFYFTSPVGPNSLDLNLVDYRILGEMQQLLYETKVRDVNELKQRVLGLCVGCGL